MNERSPTCFLSYSDYRPSSEPHALRIDQGRAQKSCNGAIYCRAALLQHVPGKTTSFHRIYGKCVNSQSVPDAQHVFADPEIILIAEWLTVLSTGLQDEIVVCFQEAGLTMSWCSRHHLAVAWNVDHFQKASGVTSVGMGTGRVYWATREASVGNVLVLLVRQTQRSNRRQSNRLQVIRGKFIKVVSKAVFVPFIPEMQ